MYNSRPFFRANIVKASLSFSKILLFPLVDFNGPVPYKIRNGDPFGISFRGRVVRRAFVFRNLSVSQI